MSLLHKLSQKWFQQVVVLALVASSSLVAPQRPEDDGGSTISAECEGIENLTDNFRCRLQGMRNLMR